MFDFCIFSCIQTLLYYSAIALGADLNNLVNQAAIRAAVENDPYVTMKHLEWAKDKIIMGKPET